jgi:hypothetical protein
VRSGGYKIDGLKEARITGILTNDGRILHISAYSSVLMFLLPLR